MSALDELLDLKNWNKSSMCWRGRGYPFDVVERAAAELAQLRAALDEARVVFKYYVPDGCSPFAAAWLKKYPP